MTTVRYVMLLIRSFSPRQRFHKPVSQRKQDLLNGYGRGVYSIPITTNCGHTFCFCCLKGACIEKDDPLCPICRRNIDTNIFDHPSIPGLSLTMAPYLEEDTSGVDKKIKEEVDEDVKPDINALKNPPPPRKFWLYKGNGNGWWRFEPRDEDDIKKAFDAGDTSVELTMCGHIYIIDFPRMLQIRKDNNGLTRVIKQVDEEELANLRVRGIAGMRCT